MAKKQESVELIAPDPLLDNLKRSATWTEKHLKHIVIGFALILGGVIAYEFVTSQSERDAAEVTSQLGDAVKAYEGATEPSKILTSTIAGALEGELEKARQKFAAVSKDHPTSGAARLAKLYEADIDRRLGKWAEAEVLYKDYVGSAKSDDPLTFIALEGAGYMLEEQGKNDDAIAYFAKIGDGSTAFYKDYGLQHKARVMLKKGDSAGAKEALKAIVAIEPPSELRPAAEDRLKTIQ